MNRILTIIVVVIKARYVLQPAYTLTTSAVAFTDTPQRASTGESNRQGAYDEREGQSSAYPLPPLLAGGSAPHSTPYFNDPDEIDLEEVARQACQGQRASTPNASIAPEPYNPILGRPPTLSSDTRVEDTIHFVIDPLLSVGLVPDSFTNYPQTEYHSQAELDESVHKSFETHAPDASEGAVHHRHLGAHSTSDAGLGHAATMLMSSGQQVSTTTDSWIPADIVGPAIVQPHLFHQHQRVVQSDVHQFYHEAADWHNQPQVFATPARPLLQRSTLPPAFVHDPRGRFRSHSEHGHPSANFEEYGTRDDSAGAGQGNYATNQHLGAQGYDKNVMTLQVPFATPSPHYRQHQTGSRASYETPQSTPDHDFGYRQVAARLVHRRTWIANTCSSQPVFGHTSAGAYQATPTDSITHSHNGGSERNSPLVRPGLGMKRSSDTSFPFTQQSTQLSYGSNEIDLGSTLATTPSPANPTKKRCSSATSRSEAVDPPVLENLVGLAAAGLVSPTTNATGFSRPPSSAASTHPFACGMPLCTKTFKTQTNLR